MSATSVSPAANGGSRQRRASSSRDLTASSTQKANYSTGASSNGSNDDQTMCQCQQFLNPFPLTLGPHQTSPSLQHYCRVCNIQLNSCRQAKIHQEGKKHQKRLHYLKICLETSKIGCVGLGQDFGGTTAPGNLSASDVSNSSNGGGGGNASTNGIVPTQGGHATTATAATVAVAAAAAAGLPAHPIYATTPQTTTGATCPNTYFISPAHLIHPQSSAAAFLHQPPPPQYHHPSSATPYGLQYPMAAALPAPPDFYHHQQHLMQIMASAHPPAAPPTAAALISSTSSQQQPQHAMSPSLTSSGFSGSGGDCKSAETSSILSSNSYASSSYNHPCSSGNNGIGKGSLNLLHHHHQFYPLSDGNNNNHHHYHHHGIRSAEGSVKSGGRPAARPLMQLQPRIPGVLGCSGGAGGSSSGSASGSMSMLDKFNPLSGGLSCPKKSGVHHLHHHQVGHRHKGMASGGTGSTHHQPRSALTQCEVCQVSVNSSQQLHAHLAGQKHRVRAIRRGLKVDQAIISPSSSTLTSASESENNFPSSAAAAAAAAVAAAAAQQKLALRRGSEVNVKQQQQQVNGILAPANAAVVADPANGKLRNRSFTLSGGGANKCHNINFPSNLSRHLSSSCLAGGVGGKLQLMSVSTSSLRKAISSSTLNKSRSMNLINYSRQQQQQQHHQHLVMSGRSAVDLHMPWSNESAGNTDECSSSVDGEDRPDYDEDEEEEEERNREEERGLEEELEEEEIKQPQQQQRKRSSNSQHSNGGEKSVIFHKGSNPAKPVSSEANNTVNTNGANCNGYYHHSNSGGAQEKVKLTKSNYVKAKKKHAASSLLQAPWNKHTSSTSARAPSSSSFSSHSSNPIKEIPMLNVFLHRLNQGSSNNNSNGGSNNKRDH